MSENKVLLPKNVAAEIERCRTGNSDKDVLAIAISDDHIKNYRFMQIFAGENFDTFLQAMVNGYEVEQTPEDKVREYYRYLQDQFPNSHAAQSADTVVILLNMLNIKIEGVNA